MNPTLIKNYVSEGAIAAFHIVKRGSSDDQIVQASAATDAVFGVAGELDGVDTFRVDINQGGQPDVQYGGTVSRGDPLVSDANGMAILASPGAGNNVRIIGFAAISAVANDIGPMDWSPSVMQG